MVTRFMWEPKGNKLCTLHGEPGRVNCTIYNVVQGKVTALVTIPDLRSIDCIFWSPAGQYCVLAQLLNLQQNKFQQGAGCMMFLDAGVGSSNPADYKLVATEHPYATDVEWDPTGRFVCTYVSAWIRPNDNEYQIWSFLGRRVRKESSLNRLVQFVWRPRLPTLFTDKELKKVKKDMKHYSRGSREASPDHRQLRAIPPGASRPVQHARGYRHAQSPPRRPRPGRAPRRRYRGRNRLRATYQRGRSRRRPGCYLGLIHQGRFILETPLFLAFRIIIAKHSLSSFVVFMK
ncbi:unnamed protein product [Oikopleura dioica]|uniref:Translation initiation factor beta propellor-like domain-containing protein n=1 Tax=Oikopleura dioica TaxID=34765 RepID=E4YKA0_OIKDI|nr:unnamed protein product [Oikopleura dioica]